jgi:DNA-nicking Smr family endonuclease
MTRKLTDEEQELWRRAERDGFSVQRLALSEKKTPNAKPQTQNAKPQAKLDLHGLTLEKAHKKFLEFIYYAVMDDLKKLLVITGKGNPGKIREEFPKWCDADYLKPYIASCKIAEPKLGGAGAFEIKLKN